MTRVNIFRRDGEYVGFEADGHAGYAEYGEDIVCAAVSVLTINTVNSIETLSKDRVEAATVDGNLTCHFPDGLSQDGKLLMDSMILGLQSIETSYGRSFIKVNTEEV